jgi:hypothetical protein
LLQGTLANFLDCFETVAPRADVFVKRHDDEGGITGPALPQRWGIDVDQLSSFAAVPVLPTRASLETDPNIVMEKVSCYKLLCLRSLQLTNKTQAQVWVFF